MKMLDHPHIIRLYQVRFEYYLCVVYLYFFSLFVVELALSSSKAVGLHDMSTRRCAASLRLWPLCSIRSDN